MVGRMEKSAADMRHGQAKEDDRTTISCHDGDKDARHADHLNTCPLDVETEILCVGIAKKHEV